MDLSKAMYHKRYKIRPLVQYLTTREEFTDVTFNDLDLSGTCCISRSSEFSVVNSTEIALNIHGSYSA